MPDELNLALPEREPKQQRPVGWVPLLLVLVLGVGVANLLVTMLGGPSRQGRAIASNGLSADEQRKLALKLERQGLHEAAARAWQAYLARAGLDDRERAKVWYQIGTVYQDGGAYQKALASFYTSESLASVIELAPEIARRTSECLEALGKFAALRHAAGERVDMGEGKAAAGEEVVAEIGPQQITKAQLDQIIEKDIDRQLAQFAPLMSPEQRKKQKEALLERFSAPQARLRALEQFVVRELLARKAHEDKLLEDPETRELFAGLERKFLAQRVMDKELAEQVKITPGDVQTFYHANLQRYRQGERAKVSRILVKDEKAEQEVRKRLAAGEKFEDLARELSLDTGTKDRGGELNGWIEKGARLGGVKPPEDLMAAVFSTEAGKVAAKTVKTKRGLHILKVREREPGRQKLFDEVRQQVHRDLRAHKGREVQERLIARLHVLHGVVVHRAKFRTEKPRTPAPKSPPPQTKGRPKKNASR